ncbi:MAG TPA: hypothetical protein VKE70_12175, partial [Candidatus Solibacter sp.]|nr:hypothetical protein [Candidatus Solibacter sp.]
HPASPMVDPPILPGTEDVGRQFFPYGPPVNHLLLGVIGGEPDELGQYSLATGKLEPMGIVGSRPAWVPGSKRHFVFRRDIACYLYDLDLKREKRLFSVSPNTIYHLSFGAGGSKLYFTQTIRDADLWLGRIGPSR